MDGDAQRPVGKPIHWVGSAKRDLKRLPGAVQQTFGAALLEVQLGRKPPNAKPLVGFTGAGVLEVTEDYDRGTYRAVYTVRFADAVYVLHVFQKKSRRGISTPRHDIELIKSRLADARADYEQWLGEREVAP